MIKKNWVWSRHIYSMMKHFLSVLKWSLTGQPLNETIHPKAVQRGYSESLYLNPSKHLRKILGQSSQYSTFIFYAQEHLKLPLVSVMCML